MYVISKQEQWRLLIGVCPLFESDLCWKSISSSPHDHEIVTDTADQFVSQMQSIKWLIPAEHSISKDAHDKFIIRIYALLASLETLLDDAIKNEECLQVRAGDDTAGGEPYTQSLRRRCPKLVALDHLLRNTNETDRLMDMSRFVHLEQELGEFKRTKDDAERFNDIIGSLSSSPRSEGGMRAIKSTLSQRRSKISNPYRSQSRHLFESLATHLRACSINASDHNAMLQLKHTEDIEDIEDQENQEDQGTYTSRPVFCMLFGSCPNKTDGWIQTHCTVTVKHGSRLQSAQSCQADTGSLHESGQTELVTKMCVNARSARQNMQFFRLKLIDKRFLDISDVKFKPENPEAIPKVSLGNLLEDGILKNRYRFSSYDKRILAYTLAHALLNLHDNPWLQTLWTLDKIHYLKSNETGMLYNIHQPYVSCVLSTKAPPLGSLDENHKYPIVLSFAKLLWELEFGERLSVTKVSKDGEPSLLTTLQDFCSDASKHQMSLGYGKALDACVNFLRYVNQEKAITKDLKMAEKQAILKYIVHELESEIDLTGKNEWGTRNLKFKLQITATEQATYEDVSEKVSQTYESTCVRSTSPTIGAESRLQKEIPEPSKDYWDCHLKGSSGPRTADEGYLTPEIVKTAKKHSNEEIDMSSGPSTPPSRSSSSTSTPPPHLINKSRSKRSTVRKRSPGHSSSYSSMTSRKRTKRAPVYSFKESLRKRRMSQLQSGANKKPRQGPPGTPYKETMQSPAQNPRDNNPGFEEKQSSSATESRPEISSKSFSYLHDVVNRYWQPCYKDEPIRVAVLDTGFDGTHDDFKQPRTETFTGKYPNIPNPKEGEKVQEDRVVAWHNFCPDREANDDVSDVDGHGTQVAGIILRLAPHVQLYVARVCRGNINRGVSVDQQEQMTQDKYANPSPDAVEKAIKWAIEKKVNVINMSLGFRKCELDEIRSLRETMHWVQKEGKAVVFAATSNQGVHERVAWPARELKCAIGVHSCCDTGREPSKSSADPIKSPDAANFMVVGENILSQWPMKKGGGFRVTTGASAATPVASAIGALVLQFVRQRRCRKYRERVKTGVTLEELFTNSGMTKVLKAISTERGGGYDAIHSELFWKDYLDNHESDEAIAVAWGIIKRALSVT